MELQTKVQKIRARVHALRGVEMDWIAKMCTNKRVDALKAGWKLIGIQKKVQPSEG